MKTRLFLTQIIAIYLILFWLFASLPKLTDAASYSEQLARLPYIGWASYLLKTFLPMFFILVAVLLVVPITKIAGLYTSLSLFVLFSFYILTVQVFSETIPCTCVGIRISLSWSGHLLINGIGIAISIVGIVLEKRNRRDGRARIHYRWKIDHQKQNNSAARP